MFQATVLLILLCLHLAISEVRYNSKRTQFIEAHHDNPPLKELMIIDNEGYNILDQHRNPVWDLYKTKMGAMNPSDVSQSESETSDFTITQADGRRGLTISIGSGPSSRLGLASPVSSNSFVWTPIKTAKKAPRTDDSSINEIDSTDYVLSNNTNSPTTTEKSIIVSRLLANNSSIGPGQNNSVGESEAELLISTTAIMIILIMIMTMVIMMIIMKTYLSKGSTDTYKVDNLQDM